MFFLNEKDNKHAQFLVLQIDNQLYWPGEKEHHNICFQIQTGRLTVFSRTSLDCTPSFSQSWHLHQDFKSGVLDKDLIFQTLSTEKANQRETIKIPMDRLRKYIPKNYTPQQAVDYLVKAADYLSRYLRRQKEQQR